MDVRVFSSRASARQRAILPQSRGPFPNPQPCIPNHRHMQKTFRGAQHNSRALHDGSIHWSYMRALGPIPGLQQMDVEFKTF